MKQAQRWLPEEPAQTALMDDRETLATWRAQQFSLRHDRGPGDRRERLRFRWAVAIAILCHILFFIGLRQWTRLQFEVPTESGVIHLRLIEQRPEQKPEPSPPDEQPLPPTHSDPVVRNSEPATVESDRPRPMPMKWPKAEPVTPVEPSTRPPQSVLGVFDRSGRVVLPKDNSLGDPSKFASQAPPETFRPNPMAHVSPLPYKPTPFDKYWTPDGETLLDEWVRKATRKSVYDTQGGTRITCEAFLFFTACGWGPIPRVTIEELKAMRVVPPMPRNSADDPYVQPDD